MSFSPETDMGEMEAHAENRAMKSREIYRMFDYMPSNSNRHVQASTDLKEQGHGKICVPVYKGALPFIEI
jgi:hypothetical protein